MATDMVQSFTAPAKVVGFRYLVQSSVYDWLRILSIVPAKVICTGLSDLAQSQRENVGELLAGGVSTIFKTSLKSEDVFVGIIGRAMAYYGIKGFTPYGHPLHALETITGHKTFLHTPEDNLRCGRIGEYTVQRALFTASTNVPATLGALAAKSLFLGAVIPTSLPAFAAVYASTYAAIYTARVVADVLQDVFNVSSLDPDRPKLLHSLEEARERHKMRQAKLPVKLGAAHG